MPAAPSLNPDPEYRMGDSEFWDAILDIGRQYLIQPSGGHSIWPKRAAPPLGETRRERRDREMREKNSEC